MSDAFISPFGTEIELPTLHVSDDPPPDEAPVSPNGVSQPGMAGGAPEVDGTTAQIPPAPDEGLLAAIQALPSSPWHPSADPLLAFRGPANPQFASAPAHAGQPAYAAPSFSGDPGNGQTLPLAPSPAQSASAKSVLFSQPPSPVPLALPFDGQMFSSLSEATAVRPQAPAPAIPPVQDNISFGRRTPYSTPVLPPPSVLSAAVPPPDDTATFFASGNSQARAGLFSQPGFGAPQALATSPQMPAAASTVQVANQALSGRLDASGTPSWTSPQPQPPVSSRVSGWNGPVSVPLTPTAAPQVEPPVQAVPQTWQLARELVARYGEFFKDNTDGAQAWSTPPGATPSTPGSTGRPPQGNAGTPWAPMAGIAARQAEPPLQASPQTWQLARELVARYGGFFKDNADGAQAWNTPSGATPSKPGLMKRPPQGNAGTPWAPMAGMAARQAKPPFQAAPQTWQLARELVARYGGFFKDNADGAQAWNTPPGATPSKPGSMGRLPQGNAGTPWAPMVGMAARQAKPPFQAAPQTWRLPGELDARYAAILGQNAGGPQTLFAPQPSVMPATPGPVGNAWKGNPGGEPGNRSLAFGSGMPSGGQPSSGSFGSGPASTTPAPQFGTSPRSFVAPNAPMGRPTGTGRGVTIPGGPGTSTGRAPNQARTYSPALGRFISADPIGPQDNRAFNTGGARPASDTIDFKSLGWEGLNLVTDLLPVIGTAKDLYEAYKDPTPLNIAAAAIGIIPGIGRVAGKGLKLGIKGINTLKPGRFARESIPARSKGRDFRADERREIDRIGSKWGCHTCGTTTPGTIRGHFIPDHQPPSALIADGVQQRLYPHCLSCSKTQGLTIGRINGRKRK